jgi:hypothetical protein
MVSANSLYLLFTLSAASEPFSAIYLLVTVPLSGAKRIPNITPAAAPANTLANTFPELIVVNF